jgi:branched-chain amino acid transport system ATP-binding protein
MLEVRGLAAGYLGKDVIGDIDFGVDAGEAVAIIGSNGAGKSTLFRAVCGLLRPSAGMVRFNGRAITGLSTFRISRRGLSYVPAERHLFPQMTVTENLALGAYGRHGVAERTARVFALFPRLAERAKQRAATMSGGEQQMLAIGRALMAQPRVLLLDEPSSGLAPKLAAETYAALAELRDRGLTILVAEQQVRLALDLAARAYVLENGHVQLEGVSAELSRNPEVRRAYLGVA